MVELCENEKALRLIGAGEIAELARRGTRSNYMAEDVSDGDLAFIDRVIRISTECVEEAARTEHQHLVAAFVDGRLAGFVIATIHSPDNRELDWLFVDPHHHGGGIAAKLMTAGMAWLGEDQPMWLNVVRHNHRAIAFYRKHGFEIDPETECPHSMPHWIMRRR